MVVVDQECYGPIMKGCHVCNRKGVSEEKEGGG